MVSLLVHFSRKESTNNPQRLQLRTPKRRLLRSGPRTTAHRPPRILQGRPLPRRILRANRLPPHPSHHLRRRSRTRPLRLASLPRPGNPIREETRHQRRGSLLRHHAAHPGRRRRRLVGLAQLGEQIRTDPSRGRRVRGYRRRCVRCGTAVDQMARRCRLGARGRVGCGADGGRGDREDGVRSIWWWWRWRRGRQRRCLCPAVHF